MNKKQPWSHSAARKEKDGAGESLERGCLALHFRQRILFGIIRSTGEQAASLKAALFPASQSTSPFEYHTTTNISPGFFSFGRLKGRPQNAQVMILTVSAISLLFVVFTTPIFAGEEGSIQFYYDIYCKQPASDASSKIGACTLANDSQYLGAAALSFPACDGGEPTLEISDTEDCNSSFQPPPATPVVAKCLNIPNAFAIASTSFRCVGGDTSNAGSTTSSSPVDQPTASASGQSTKGPPGPNGKYSIADTIALGVGLGVGLPSLLASAFVCFFGTDFFRREFGGGSVPRPIPPRQFPHQLPRILVPNRNPSPPPPYTP
jgi:hypothetical protein